MKRWTRSWRCWALVTLAVITVGLGVAGSIYGWLGNHPLREVEGQQAGESSSDYDFSSDASRRIKSLFPDPIEVTYVSVSSAAFKFFPPKNTSVLFDYRSGSLCDPLVSTTGDSYYYAPVQLPHGTTVTEVSVLAIFTEGYGENRLLEEGTHRADLYCKLMRTADPLEVTTRGRVNPLEMAVCGIGSHYTNPTTSITAPAVDNSRHAYYLVYNPHQHNDASIHLYSVNIVCAFLGGEEVSEGTSF